MSNRDTLGADLLTRMVRVLEAERNLLLLDMRDLLESLSVEQLCELTTKDDEAIAATLRQMIELDNEPDQSCPRYQAGSGYTS